MASNWYFARQGQQFGPVSSGQLKEMARTCQLLPTDMIWKQGMDSWVSAGSLPDLFPQGGVTRAGVLQHPATVSPTPRLASRSKPSAWITIGGTLAAVTLLCCFGLVFLNLLSNRATKQIVAEAKQKQTTQEYRPEKPMPEIRPEKPMPEIRPEKPMPEIRPEKPMPEIRPPGDLTKQFPELAKVDYSIDFEGVDYSTDFSKVDYSKGPAGQKINQRTRTKNGVKITESGFMENGKFVLHGPTVVIGEGGKGETYYFNGKMHGTVRNWFKSGTKKYEGACVEGQSHGKSEEWYENGQRKNEGWWYRGKLHGSVLGWHANGQMMEKGQYKQGGKHGKCLNWWPNGKVSDEFYYLDGKRHGILTSWYDNGQIRCRGVALHGGDEGTWRFWHKNGLRKEEAEVSKGQYHGKRTFWYADGSLRENGEWQNGKIKYKQETATGSQFRYKMEDLLQEGGSSRGSLIGGGVGNYAPNSVIDTFGKPQSDRGDGNGRVWKYKCSDGTVDVHCSQVGARLIISNL